jgi:hypothetical protein
MPELERDLREVGRLLAFPPEPELVPAVRTRLGEAPRPVPFVARRRVLVLALAALVVAIGAAFAVPPARTAILRFFHIGGETIERVPTLPNAPHRSPIAGLAGPMSVEDATDRAGFNPILPSKHGAIYADDGILATYIAPRVVLTEARSDLGMSKKVASPTRRAAATTRTCGSPATCSCGRTAASRCGSRGRSRGRKRWRLRPRFADGPSRLTPDRLSAI